MEIKSYIIKEKDLECNKFIIWDLNVWEIEDER
jgi:hypothetical protein